MGVALAGFHELEMHGLHRLQVLLNHGIHGTTAFTEITGQAPYETDVGVGIHEHPDVHHLSKRLLGQDENPFHDHYRPGVCRDGAAGPRMGCEVIHRHLYGPARPQFLQMADQEVRLKRVRMVVVDMDAIFRGDVAAIPVVGIVLDDGDVVWAQVADDAGYYGGLAGSGASGNAYDDRRRAQPPRPLATCRSPVSKNTRFFSR